MRRVDTAFQSGGKRCAAWLYEPDAEPPWACVVMAHGLGGTREGGLGAYAECFAAAGMAVLLFDYRHLGASEGEPRQLVSIGRQLEDWRSALSNVRGRPEIDRERIALWGTSLSGGHVIGTAARDGGLACVVAQIPHLDGLAALREVGARTAIRLTAAGLRDAARAIRRAPPWLVPIAGPPGSLAFLTAPDADEGLRALYPPGELRNEVAARVALSIGAYRPVRSAPKVNCPLLVCIADRDTITPPEPAARAAAAAPHGEARHYDAVHFEIYQGLLERVVSDQTEFLARHLLASAEAPERRVA